MKSILMVCNRSNFDAALRRSLAHLVNSCRIDIVSDGYAAFKELSEQAYNLVIIDFELDGIDGLELVESVSYIDPDVPVILMLSRLHRAMWGEARRFGANPILRPFKPLIFLRLVDTLLHQHLERFRELSEAMQSVVTALAEQPGIACVFLFDADGQTLLSANPLDPDRQQALGRLAATEAPGPSEPLLPPLPTEKDHNLCVVQVLENLGLAALVHSAGTPLLPDDLWPNIEQAAQDIRQAIFENTAAQPPIEKNQPAERKEIPIRLNPETQTAVEQLEPFVDDDDVAVNWAIISTEASTLNRLRKILSE